MCEPGGTSTSRVGVLPSMDLRFRHRTALINLTAPRRHRTHSRCAGHEADSPVDEMPSSQSPAKGSCYNREAARRQAASRIFNDREQLLSVRAGPIERQLGDNLGNGHDSCARLVHALQCQIITDLRKRSRGVSSYLNLIPLLQHLQHWKSDANFRGDTGHEELLATGCLDGLIEGFVVHRV